MNSDDARARFVEELRKCSGALLSASSGAPLRTLQHFANAMLFNTADRSMKAVCFIMDQWVKDYYFNFAGDVVSPRWERVEQIRKDLLQQKASRAIDLLATAVAEGAEPTKALEELITSYLDAISAANLELAQAS
jgi:hypothetical protein